MLKESIIYSLITILVLALIDKIRIQKSWGVVGNIKHWISGGLAILASLIQWIIMYGFTINLHILFFFLSCIAIRGIFYDPALNLFRGLKIDYVSNTSSSEEEQRLNRVSFWKRRGLFLLSWGVTFAVVKIWSL